MPTFDEKRDTLHAHRQSEYLPKAARVALGAAGRDVSDKALRKAVAGKVVLITGASSGIGAATARRVANAGATALLVARSVNALEDLRAEIVAAGGRAHVHPADLREADKVDALVAEVLDQYGHVDIVVNNAGLSIRRWISDSYDRFHDIERTNAINFLGPARLLMGLLPSMRARGGGQIINVSTVGANIPGPEWSAYVSTKTAFDSWLRSVSPEIAADGVATTTIYMMMVRTPMLGGVWYYRYLPGMNPDEAAGMAARAMVTRERVMMPWWARVGIPAMFLAQEPVERALTLYSKATNPSSRPPALDRALAAAAQATGFGADLVGAAGTVARTGLIRPIRPDRPVRALLALQRHGMSPATAAAAAAALWGGRTAVIDEFGEITYTELNDRIESLAAAMHDRAQLGPGRRIGVLCRNHRGFLEAAYAGARTGADLVPLNSDFAGPQLAEVLAREAIDVLVHDQEFAAAVASTDFGGLRVTALHDGTATGDTVESLVAEGNMLANVPIPAKPGQMVFLTSGTTGTPKGAPREINPFDLLPMALGGVGLMARFEPAPPLTQAALVTQPLYHGYGFLAAMGLIAIGSPVVLLTRFDPERALAAVEKYKVGLVCAVPTILKRIMDLPDDVRRGYDCSSLQLVACGAAPLPPELGTAFMDEYGDILLNGYGSTEVGAGSLALPADLRAAPGTVGRVAPGTTLKIFDDAGNEVPAGVTGRIFVGSALLFDGYSGGGTKERIGKLMSIGDVGHFDSAGRLFIDGRDDDMIVSGGENVFPQEVEELISTHAAVADAAAVGVPDEKFGQRLVVAVVLKDGQQVEAQDLQELVRSNLARYKVPRDVLFVDALPRTSTGKIKRARLRDQLVDRESAN